MLKKVFLYLMCILRLTSILGQNETKIYLQRIQKKDTILTTFNEFKNLENHIAKISLAIQQEGYFASYYSAPLKINDSLYQTRLTAHRKTNIIKIDNWDALKKMTIPNKEEFIEGTKIVDYLKSLNNIFSSQGNPFNTVQLKNLRTKQDTLIASLHISNLQPRKVDSIIIKGYSKFPKAFAKYYAGIRRGIVYDNEKVIKKATSLNNLPFISTIKPAEVLFNPKKTTLFLYLQKKNANNFDGFLGFATNEESGNFELNGYLHLNLVNNLHFGETVNLTYKSDNDDQTQLNVKTKLPYLFKSPLGLVGQINIFRQKEAFSSTELRLGLNYALSSKSEVLIGYASTESADLTDNTLIAGTISQDFNASFLNLQYQFIQRKENLLFPIKSSLLLDAEVGNRQKSLQPKINQYKFQLKGNYIFQINKRNSIYIQNELRYLNSENYIFNELFRFGGILSIRGFEENSLRASFFNVVNTEYRYQLSETIYAHSIIDFAIIDNQASKTNNDPAPIGSDNLTSFGIGIGLITKSGLFKLNYANGTSKNIPFKFSNSKVHFSLTAFF